MTMVLKGKFELGTWLIMDFEACGFKRP